MKRYTKKDLIYIATITASLTFIIAAGLFGAHHFPWIIAAGV